ncbi:MAG: hypothetical protein HRT47_09900 [Candidatus Caenarcaniphilales bacterium]|nr:hypothetical protein [Candidatus Caenarcaniphilales bacterium]
MISEGSNSQEKHSIQPFKSGTKRPEQQNENISDINTSQKFELKMPPGMKLSDLDDLPSRQINYREISEKLLRYLPEPKSEPKLKPKGFFDINPFSKLSGIVSRVQKKLENKEEEGAKKPNIDLYSVLSNSAKKQIENRYQFAEDFPVITSIVIEAINNGDMSEKDLDEFKQELAKVETSADGMKFLGKLLGRFDGKYNHLNRTREDSILSTSRKSSFYTDIVTNSSNNARNSQLQLPPQPKIRLDETLKEVFSRGQNLFSTDSPIKLLSIQPNGYQSSKMILEFKAKSGLNTRVQLVASELNPRLKIGGLEQHSYNQLRPEAEEFLLAFRDYGIDPTTIVADGYRDESYAAWCLENVINAFVQAENKPLLETAEDLESNKEAIDILSQEESSMLSQDKNSVREVKLHMHKVPRNFQTVERYKAEEEMLYQHKLNIDDLNAKAREANKSEVELVFNPTSYNSVKEISSIKDKVVKAGEKISDLKPEEILKLNKINGIPVQNLEQGMRPSFHGIVSTRVIKHYGNEVASNYKLFDGGGTASSGFIGLTDHLVPVIAAQKALLNELNISVQDYADKVEEAIETPRGERLSEFKYIYDMNGRKFTGDEEFHVSGVSSPFYDGKSSNYVKSMTPVDDKDFGFLLSSHHKSMIEKYCFSESSDGITKNGYAIFPHALKAFGLTDIPNKELKARYEELKQKYTDQYLEEKEDQINAMKSLKIFKTNLFANYFLTNTNRVKSKEAFEKILNNSISDSNKLSEAKEELDVLNELDKDWYTVCENYAYDLKHDVLRAKRREFIDERAFFMERGAFWKHY